jgi:hypothetical protein
MNTSTSSSAVSSAVIASMFKHLTASYSPDEAREILVNKYPDNRDDINSLQADRPTAQDVADAIDNETDNLVAAVKAKTAKSTNRSKPAKQSAEHKVTKIDRARELYANATDKSRKAMIELFTAELGLSTAAASTYYYNVKR